MTVILNRYFITNVVFLLWMNIGAINCANSTDSPDGIRCLECHEVAAPSDCTQWVTCGHDEECYVREFYNRNMERGYHMGCELKSRCDLYRRMAAVLGRRSAPDCFQCCDKDDCNTALCTAGSSSVVTNSNLRCLDCHSVLNPRLCDKWSRCGDDEVCFTRAYVGPTGQEMFRMGCEFKQMCSVSSSGGATTTSDPRTCMECCSTEDCNAQLCNAVVGYTVSTSSPTARAIVNGCPLPFMKRDNSCYYISNVTSQWADAHTACENLGAELVSVTSQHEDDVLEDLLNTTARAKATGYWIGGYFVTATNDWRWMDLHPMTFTKWGPNQPTKSRYNYWYTYRVAMLNPAKNSGYTAWSWAATSYSTRYNYICETDVVQSL